MRNLSGKRVLITGGARGIGAATTKRFLEEGSRVVVLDRYAPALDEIKKELPNLEDTILADISNLEDVSRVFKHIDQMWNGLDVLINNAGISIRHRFMDITPEEWHQIMNTNLTGLFYMAKEAAKRMLAAQKGVIINMGSTSGFTGYHYYADYNASKAGVIELSRSMALELAPYVRVIALCPGYVLTPMQEAEYTPEMMREVDSKIPLGRQARPEEMAAVFAFLASDDASYITGCAITADGGETAGGLASQKTAFN
ncbi:MAG: oxidoreductase [Chloroflexi bacterium RBG_19FT_COMBO_47_9]|nr:MAG: oxidoreductase [Chloroflexi bacterium RBG_19FT_COMBO_47_9]